MRCHLAPGLFAVLYSSIILFYGEGSYVLGSSKKEDVIIAKKYTYVKNGSTNFMVIDAKGRHFNVDNCFYYWNWNTIEDWGNLKPLDERQINYYSYRVPFLGMYPTIVEFTNKKQIKSDESDNKQIERGDIIKHLHL